MFRLYSELNALPPEDFLNPENFVTGYDEQNPDYAEKQYREGLRLSNEYDRITICANGTWTADIEGPHTYRWLTSTEGIGYHAHTASLLRGFLDGPAPVDVARRQSDYSVKTTRIKEASK
ncbi:hypothetical protein ABT115_08865 [Streptomyces sp. NPDC001832]|uniref:hypothetical protein n=1 Tax=Streptomyces sp. NPDC001832 TaxID=3154527 RepID=UPI00332FA973